MSSATAVLDWGTQIFESQFQGQPICLPPYGLPEFPVTFEHYDLLTWSMPGPSGTVIPLTYSRNVGAVGAHGEGCQVGAVVTALNGSYIQGIPECRQTNVIKLSPAYGSQESATVLTSVEPTDRLSNASGRNATYLIARVYDQNGVIVTLPRFDVHQAIQL